MRALRRAMLPTLALAALASTTLAHVRLQHPSNGNVLYWGSPSNIGIVISSAGSDDVPGDGDTTALRNAIAAWNEVELTTATLVENTSPVQQARTDWESDGIHMILFDETNDSGYFPSGSGTVAITPIWFNSSGAISDADILFNGSGWEFTTAAVADRFDVQDVAAHEIGHLLGLDHSGWAGATMYPYVDPTVILHRSLAADDVLGLRDAYPAQSFAMISGTIRHSADSSLVLGAHVVACDADGRTAAGALSDDEGEFVLRALAAGTYTLYATPLDFPVSAGNLGQGHTIQTDFASTAFGAFAVTAGQALAVGDLVVDPNVSLRLGSNADEYPFRCTAGLTSARILRGSGLNNGSTLTASDPSITISNVVWLGSQVNFDVSVPAGAARGHFDVTVTNGSGDVSTLVAPLEVTPRDPIVSTVSPASGSRNGGTSVTITGSHFAAGARVVIGANVYPDGAIGGATVVDSSTIQLTTAAMSAGTFDVVVIDASGVEGRKVAAFQAAALPTIVTSFPAAGSASGGTRLVLRGAEFDAAASVRIDGIQQTQVTVASSTQIELFTNAGVPGGPYVVEVENPGGAIATSAFTYTPVEDPAIVSIDPPNGSASGGDVLVVHGSNFSASTQVVFGAHEDTGLGGTAAASVVFVDSDTLQVTTPSHASGAHNVMVQDGVTGQAFVAAAAFTFQSSGGGGGGGCSVVPHQGPSGPRDALSGVAWMLATFALLMLFVERERRRAATLVRVAKSARR